ncbi:hypothetical protein IEQ34_007606 [Dendrobium chrysotoxum]|uniref:Uncharacterized protein n=1 Tax=Dendrobium chrysotoxum TaxID=161865 RepID=A0AAV7H5F1_DENCH|nr:hypothetical protein IEQ34_007606 [Dendrobium chrysotoxum]
MVKIKAFHSKFDQMIPTLRQSVLRHTMEFYRPAIVIGISLKIGLTRATSITQRNLVVLGSGTINLGTELAHSLKPKLKKKEKLTPPPKRGESLSSRCRSLNVEPMLNHSCPFINDVTINFSTIYLSASDFSLLDLDENLILNRTQWRKKIHEADPT